MTYHLAHLNVALAQHPVDDPRMAGFFDAVGAINALAEQAPGFVWRMVDESADPTWRTAFPDPLALTAMSTWESIEALRQFVYKSTHVDFMRRRQEWFQRQQTPNLVLWWIPAGHRPSLGEARHHLDLLTADGPTPQAFTFGMPFPAPEQPGS